MGPGILPETAVVKHHPPCYLQMPTKILSRKNILRPNEEGDLPACYQRSVQKPASLMVWGCTSVYGMGSMHVLEGTMNAEMYIK